MKILLSVTTFPLPLLRELRASVVIMTPMEVIIFLFLSEVKMVK